MCCNSNGLCDVMLAGIYNVVCRCGEQPRPLVAAVGNMCAFQEFATDMAMSHRQLHTHKVYVVNVFRAALQ